MTAVQRYLQVSVTASQPPSLTVEYDWAYERWLASQVHFTEYSTATWWSYRTVPLVYHSRAGAVSLQILT